MVDSVHKNLTGADLHEPKGADTALADQVYVSDGAGSGSWQTASTIITNSAWSTGDLKVTHKATADSGWVMWSDGTIGDGSSSATIRANADCYDLFALYWDDYSDTLCPVSTGRGASAVADFAAHKTITLPKGAGRALALSGTGSGLTARTLGAYTGVEAEALTQAQLPNVSPTFTGTQDTVTVNSTRNDVNVDHTSGNSGTGVVIDIPFARQTLTSTGLFTPRGTVSALGSGATHSLVQPTSFVNVMVKL